MPAAEPALAAGGVPAPPLNRRGVGRLGIGLHWDRKGAGMGNRAAIAAFLLAAVAGTPKSVLPQDGVPRGTYLELFYGTKSGGPSMHQDLLRRLRKDEELVGFAFYCISGLSRAADSKVPGIAIDRERLRPPQVVKQCRGSAAILVGPVSRNELESIQHHLSTSGQYLHLYADVRVIE